MLPGDNEETAWALADLGPVAHPMLEYTLRAPNPQGVKAAAEALILQRTAGARAIVEQALRDPTIPFRAQILDAVGANELQYPASLVATLAGVYGGAPPRLREAIVRELWNALKAGQKPPARGRIFEVLAKALTDEDREVRELASTTESWAAYREYSDSYATALVERAEARDPALHESAYRALPWLAARPELAPRIEKVLSRDKEELRTILKWGVPRDERALVVMTRAILPHLAGENPRGLSPLHSNLQNCAARSTQAAALIAEWVLGHEDAFVATKLSLALGTRRSTDAFGDRADDLREQAIRLLARGSPRGAQPILTLAGFDASHFEMVVRVLQETQSEWGIRSFCTSSYLKMFGPERATRLARLARRAEEFNALVEGVGPLMGTLRQSWDDFFAAVVPGTDYRAVGGLKAIAGRNKASADLVARYLLETEDRGWNWNTGGEPEGPAWWNSLLTFVAVARALRREPLRSELLRYTNDPRLEIALQAVDAVAGVKTPEATRALVQALGSSFSSVREKAITALGGRGAEAADALTAHLEKKRPTGNELSHLLGSLGRCGHKRHAAAVAKVLAGRPEDLRPAWDAYMALDAKAATDFALKEVTGPGSPRFRGDALKVLEKTSDRRRLDVFRKILEGHITGVRVLSDVRISSYEPAEAWVLKVVAEQYLVELGRQALDHLRSPDGRIRGRAQRAVEKLKFYAEAREAFERRERDRRLEEAGMKPR
ncbi:MAG: HEAT repeat domain-containing protein [Planctomycetota bacterium]